MALSTLYGSAISLLVRQRCTFWRVESKTMTGRSWWLLLSIQMWHDNFWGKMCSRRQLHGPDPDCLSCDQLFPWATSLIWFSLRFHVAHAWCQFCGHLSVKCGRFRCQIVSQRRESVTRRAWTFNSMMAWFGNGWRNSFISTTCRIPVDQWQCAVDDECI